MVDAPPAAPAQDPKPQVTPPAEQPPPAEPKAAEVESVEVGGEKYVPLSALMGERRERQDLKAKADRADQLEGWMRDAKPYVEFLQANPQLMQPRQPEPAKAEPDADPDALEAAKLMDFYTPDGKPDTARGAQWLKLQDRRAAHAAQQAVQPLAQTTAQQRSQQHFALAMQFKDADGRSPSRESLEQVWRAMPPEYTADPAVASLLAVTALGLDQMQKKSPPAPPGKEPLITEPSGGEPRPRGAMTELETRVAAQRGVAPDKWQERTKGFQQGRPSPLED